MHHLEISLKLAALSLFLTACLDTNPTTPPLPIPLPSTLPTTFSIPIGPIDVGELTLIRVSGDLSFELTFLASTNITSLPELITIAGHYSSVNPQQHSRGLWSLFMPL